MLTPKNHFNIENNNKQDIFDPKDYGDISEIKESVEDILQSNMGKCPNCDSLSYSLGKCFDTGGCGNGMGEAYSRWKFKQEAIRAIEEEKKNKFTVTFRYGTLVLKSTVIIEKTAIVEGIVYFQLKIINPVYISKVTKGFTKKKLLKGEYSGENPGKRVPWITYASNSKHLCVEASLDGEIICTHNGKTPRAKEINTIPNIDEEQLKEELSQRIKLQKLG